MHKGNWRGGFGWLRKRSRKTLCNEPPHIFTYITWETYSLNCRLAAAAGGFVGRSMIPITGAWDTALEDTGRQ